jgi:hypothetical protein
MENCDCFLLHLTNVEKDLYMQLNAELVFKEDIPLRLGQEAFIRLEVNLPFSP